LASLRDYLFHEEPGITLYCGDARAVLPLMDAVADLVLADPPYSSGGAFRSDRNRDTSDKYQHAHETHRTYDDFAGDNRDQRSFEKWSAYWMADALIAARPEGVIGCFIDWRNVACVVDAMQVGGWVYRGLVPWHKGIDQRPRKGWFRHNVEFIGFGSRGPLETGAEAPGICADGVLYCRINGTEKLHQTGKPVDLFKQIIGVRPDWQTVLDPFCGSGTTLEATKSLGRTAIGIEIEPRYCEIAVKRLRQEVLAL
jgi:site-specific DNA-methyltransferase (adenine-specific)